MWDKLRRWDEGWARGEAAIATFVLVSLVLVAALQATLRNLTNLDLQWANEALNSFDWADSFMQKSTLWLAFFGASLATHGDKHIAIDIFSKIVSPKVRAAMRGLVGIAAGVICFILARVFWMSVMNNAQELPLDYAVLTSYGDQHICDVKAAVIAEAGLSRPSVFCGTRWVLSKLGVHVATVDSTLQLVAPAMFLLISIRFIFKGIGAFLTIPEGGIEEEVGDDMDEKIKRAAALAGDSAEEPSDEADEKDDSKGEDS